MYKLFKLSLFCRSSSSSSRRRSSSRRSSSSSAATAIIIMCSSVLNTKHSKDNGVAVGKTKTNLGGDGGCMANATPLY